MVDRKEDVLRGEVSKVRLIERNMKGRLKSKDGLLPDGRCPLEYLDSHP